MFADTILLYYILVIKYKQYTYFEKKVFDIKIVFMFDKFQPYMYILRKKLYENYNHQTHVIDCDIAHQKV